MESVRIGCSTGDLVKWRDLNEFQGNLKTLTKSNYEKLKNEILKNGFCFPFFVWQNPENRFYILDGHQRKATLLKMSAEKKYISIPEELPAVIVQAASEKDAKRKLLAATSQYGKMTRPGLKEFIRDADLDLEDVKLSFEFGSNVNFEFLDVGDPLNPEKDGRKYTEKIEVGKYLPNTDKKPNLNTLVDLTKTQALIKEIENSKVTDKEKEFLKAAAYRHAVFDYANIADYYVNSNTEIQRLFENSVLVVIDIDKAIETGIVKLTQEIQDLLAGEYSDE